MYDLKIRQKKVTISLLNPKHFVSTKSKSNKDNINIGVRQPRFRTLETVNNIEK